VKIHNINNNLNAKKGKNEESTERKRIHPSGYSYSQATSLGKERDCPQSKSGPSFSIHMYNLYVNKRPLLPR